MLLTHLHLKELLLVLLRGAVLYILIYLYIYIGVPLIQAFDSQAQFPLSVQILFYGAVWVLFDAYRELSRECVKSVFILDSPVQVCTEHARETDLRLRVSVRPGRISMGLPGLKRAPHRAVRFGRTRRR